MFNLGGLEILVILVVALLVLGPDKLPKFMRTVGKAVGELRRASTELQRSISLAEAAAEESLPEDISPAAPPITAADEMPDTSTALPRSHKRSPRLFRAKRKPLGQPDTDGTENS